MCFVCVDDVEWEELEWGDLGWVVRPANVPDADRLCVLDVKIQPGQGHDFHRHPNQEEVIFLRSGTVEQFFTSLDGYAITEELIDHARRVAGPQRCRHRGRRQPADRDHPRRSLDDPGGHGGPGDLLHAGF